MCACVWQATIKYAVAEAFSFNFKPTLVLARGAARDRARGNVCGDSHLDVWIKYIMFVHLDV